MSARVKDLNLAEMSDDEITNFDPSKLEESEENLPLADEQGVDPSATSLETEDNATDVTDGADSEDDSSDKETEDADTTSVEESIVTDTEAQTKEKREQTSDDNQSTDAGSLETKATDDSTSNLDYKTEYFKLLAPFKAAKREIKIDNPEDARRLMQMGVDYARKMEQMKPYRRVLKTLEKAELIDVDKINFLIDLSKKDPAAIRKFLKDSDIDPIDLEIEDGDDYKPTNHIISDNEIALDDILDEIRGTPSFDKTIQIVTKEWDSASQQSLIDNPGVIQHLNNHIGFGIYDKIADKVATERALGKLLGLSDLEAYKAVGDAMYDNGEFENDLPDLNTSSSAGKASQGGSHPNGSDAGVKARKRAASPTKGSAGTGKKIPNWAEMSDEQIEQFDISTL